MPPSNLECEGYWTSPGGAIAAAKRRQAQLDRNINPPPGVEVFISRMDEYIQEERDKIREILEIGDYLPIVSTKIWPGKELWAQKVAAIEAYIRSLPEEDSPPMNLTISARRNRKGTAYLEAEGLSPSRLIKEVDVGHDEYEDNGICWPGGYVKHYIVDNNVMPTERFYNYVNARFDTLPPEFRNYSFPLE